MLYIIRGLPGSGKSTLARSIVARGLASAYYEADMFFVRNGRYRFNPNYLRDAHCWCKGRVFNGLAQGRSIVVSNTFTTYREMAEYIEYAKAHGVPFKVIRLDTQYGSIHNVPHEAVERMRERFEDYQGEQRINRTA